MNRGNLNLDHFLNPSKVISSQKGCKVSSGDWYLLKWFDKCTFVLLFCLCLGIQLFSKGWLSVLEFTVHYVRCFYLPQECSLQVPCPFVEDLFRYCECPRYFQGEIRRNKTGQKTPNQQTKNHKPHHFHCLILPVSKQISQILPLSAKTYLRIDLTGHTTHLKN